MSLVKQIGYIGFEVSDLKAWEEFSSDVLGLMVVGETKKGFNLKLDSNDHRIFVTEGPCDDVFVIGFEVDDEDALRALSVKLAENDVPVEWGQKKDFIERGVKNLIRCKDPSGVPLEFYYGPSKNAVSFASKHLKEGFVAEDQGFGHVVVSCLDQEATKKFYMDTLGFLLSDTICLDFGRVKFDITFTHINARHHSLAFSSPMPKKIHHFMLQAKNIDEVGRALDRTKKKNLKVTQGLGRHSNDKMFSFYAKTPSGFEFEFGADAIEIDDSNWVPTVYDRGSDWGHHRS